MNKDYFKDCARKLMFEMKEESYDNLVKEFSVIEKQITMMESVEGIKDIKPMAFPFVTYEAKLREDKESESLTIDEVLKNADSSYLDQVKVPKVVE